MAQALNSDFATEVNNFITICEKNSVDLTLFYKNLKTLDIKSVKTKMVTSTPFAGVYDTNQNTIEIALDGIDHECIYHELFHIASRRKTDTHIYTGFSRNNTEYSVVSGTAINEGFTELLAGKYFNKNEGYQKEQCYVSMLSEIIGFEIMERLYLKGDFDGLIDEFSKYVSEEEVYLFIDFFDKYSYYEMQKDENSKAYIQICVNILTKAYKNKLATQNISAEEKRNNFLYFITDISNVCFTNKNTMQKNIMPAPKRTFVQEAFDELQIDYVENEDGTISLKNPLQQKVLTKENK